MPTGPVSSLIGLGGPVYPSEHNTAGVITVDPSPEPGAVDHTGARWFQAGDDPDRVVDPQRPMPAVGAVRIGPVAHEPIEPLGEPVDGGERERKRRPSFDLRFDHPRLLAGQRRGHGHKRRDGTLGVRGRPAAEQISTGHLPPYFPLEHPHLPMRDHQRAQREPVTRWF